MAPNTSMPIGWADSFGRKLRIGAAARRSYGLARGAQGMGIAAEDLQVRSSPVAFRKIEAPYLVGGASAPPGKFIRRRLWP